MYSFKKLSYSSLLALNPNYVRPSLIGGSVLFWVYLIQVITGFILAIVYSFSFDTGTVGVIYFWWETFNGAMLARLHSEFGNILFFMLYVHIIIKFWNNTYNAEMDQTWISGSLILIFIYITGITGAIMPTSILAEVTATVIGYAINSLSFINFDFLGTLLIPGLGLTDDTMFRVFMVHMLMPVLALIVILEHTGSLHCTEYTDEDEMDVSYFSRFEYWDDFIWIEVYCWFEVFFGVLTLRFILDFFWPEYMSVTYSCSNFEFWPLQDDIDFTLAIPHWYLRPLMSSLVVIPHHYIGFFYVIFFFMAIIILPWFSSTFRISNPSYLDEFLYYKFPIDFSRFGMFFFIIFVMSLSYATLIVPTGRYFVSLGSNEILVFCFWYILNYIVLYRVFSTFAYVAFYYCVL